MIITTSVLVALALVDGACSGFRSSLGRTGLVRHGPMDRRSAVLGAVVVALLLLPAAVVAGTGLELADVRPADFESAARSMLYVLAPYALVVVIALVAYGALGWRQKYLAMALVLGPFTLMRPVVVLAAVAAGVLGSPSWIPPVVIGMGAAALLTVEPLIGLRWRPQRTG